MVAPSVSQPTRTADQGGIALQTKYRGNERAVSSTPFTGLIGASDEGRSLPDNYRVATVGGRCDGRRRLTHVASHEGASVAGRLRLGGGGDARICLQV